MNERLGAAIAAQAAASRPTNNNSAQGADAGGGGGGGTGDSSGDTDAGSLGSGQHGGSQATPRPHSRASMHTAATTPTGQPSPAGPPSSRAGRRRSSGLEVDTTMSIAADGMGIGVRPRSSMYSRNSTRGASMRRGSGHLTMFAMAQAMGTGRPHSLPAAMLGFDLTALLMSSSCVT